ncbi:MAG: carboxypeptidase regulatory-like domain-containing protein, partial [Desulfurococcaceae archaeon]
YIKPDFSAPGVSITSSVPGGGYEAWSGTSMATPHVAGLVALILQATAWYITPEPDTPEKVYLILNSTALDFGDPGQDIRYGWGRVDAYEAVKKALEYVKKSGVEGFVLDEVTGEPVTWATVTVVEVDLTVPVNKTGGFRIPLDPGNYTLVFSAWGYYNVTVVVEVVLLNGTITGTVYNAITNVPVPGALVTVVELNLTTVTDENGVFTVSVPPGRYNLTVTAQGYAPYSTTVTIDEAELVYLNIPLFPIGNGTIAGYVVEAGTGVPVVDALVWTYVAGSPVYNYTNSAGYYELNVPSGIYTVYAYKPGYVQANVTGVIVAPSTITWVNITLEKIPPTVVVLANVDYRTRPHLKDIVSSLGLPVVEYNNMTKLLEDWVNGLINPAVVIIDHTMPSPYSYPPADIVLLFHQWADAVGSSLIWLGTSYSGYTGIDVLLLFNTTLVANGYPAPNSRLIGYPSPTFVQVTMLNMTHPIFINVTPDIPPNVFYLGTGSYADYAIYNFTDPTGRFTILAYVNDTRPGFGRFGVGVAEWISNTGVPWYYLGSWAESYWMQYLEPGADGMYTNNTQRVLENAILLGWSYAVGSQGAVNRELLPQVLAKIAFFLEEQSYSARKVALEPQLYTPVTVYLPRLPHGYITGRVVGADGVILEGAVVEVLDTPVKLTTNATGHFYTWLPVGAYTLRISAPGYKPRLINVTVEEGVLLDLGDVILPTVLRIATLYDYGDILKRLFEERGWYARSYTNISQLTDDILAGMYHVVVYAGYYGVPFPTATEFFRFLNATFEKGVGVVWMDSWGTHGYGIKVLNRYLGDPPVVGSSWGSPVYIRVTRSHPILRGYSVGQDVLIVTYSSADFSWFTGFSGEAIADTVAGGVVRGNSIAWKTFENGVKWALLSSFAPTSWNLPTYFTTDAWNIICNAVIWVASKPLNIVVDKPYVRVGETISINITGGPALTEIIVAFAGEEIGRVVTDEQGNAFLTYTIPLIPGGKYTVEAYTEDLLYHGFTDVTIVPDLKVNPLTVRAPGMVYVEATGLMPYQAVYIYLDGNWLSFIRANISGAFSLVLNIPLVAEGYHSITLVDPDTGGDLVSQEIMVTSQLDEITNIVVDIRDRLIALEPVILSIDGNVAMVLTKLGIIEVDVAEIKQLLEEQNAVLVAIKDDVAIIRTDVGVVRARVEALYPILLSIQGYVVLVLTQLGEIRSDLRTIMSMIESSRDAVISEIRGGVAELKLYMDESTTTLSIKLDSLTSLVESSRSAVIERIENGTATLRLELAGVETRIKAKLDALEPVLIRVNETTATILTRIGVLETNVSSILRSLAELNATITRVSGDVATVITSIGELRVNVSNLVDYLRSVNATIIGLIVDSRGAVLAQITTTQGVIQADLSTINSLIKAGLPISTAELRDFIDKLVKDTGRTVQESVNTVSENVQSIEARLSELERRIENIEQASGRIEQTGVYSIASMVLVIVAILLLAYQIVLLRKPK